VILFAFVGGAAWIGYQVRSSLPLHLATATYPAFQPTA
jgi:hypothetical protein